MGEQPKVFEFAKEVGMETLTLMDKIKEWKIPVKSHMASLSEEVIAELYSRIEEEAAATKGKKKTKKKVATKKATTKKKVTKKTVAKKVTAKKATAKKATSKKQ